MIISSSMLSAYLNVIRKGLLGKAIVPDLYVIADILLIIGTPLFLIALLGTLLSMMGAGEAFANFGNFLRSGVSRALGSERPRRIRHASARGVLDPAAPNSVAVDLKWTVPRPEDGVDEILISRVRDFRMGEVPVTQIHAADPSFATGEFHDNSVEANTRYEYLFRAVSPGGTSWAFHVRARTPAIPIPPGPAPTPGTPPAPAPGPAPDPYAGLPAWARSRVGSSEQGFIVDVGLNHISTPINYYVGDPIYVMVIAPVGQTFMVPRGVIAAGSDAIGIQEQGGAHRAISQNIVLADYQPGGGVPRVCGWVVVRIPAPNWAAIAPVNFDVYPMINVS